MWRRPAYRRPVRGLWPGRPAGVDVLVAAAAGHQGLAPPHGHEVHPCGFLASARLAEIGELADVVDLQVHRVLADLTASGQEPVDQLVAPGAGHDRPPVGEDGCAHSSERGPAEAGDQWFPSPVAFDGDLQALSGSGGCLDGGLVLAGLRGDRRTVLACQRLQQRGLHDPVETARAEHIPGDKVVLDETGVLGSVFRDDGAVVVVEQRAALRWLSLVHVEAHRCLMTVLGTNSPIAPLTARRPGVILVSECRAWIS